MERLRENSNFLNLKTYVTYKIILAMTENKTQIFDLLKCFNIFIRHVLFK